MENLLGKKMKGFKFTHGETGVSYFTHHDYHLGKIGTIIGDGVGSISVIVMFEDYSQATYPKLGIEIIENERMYSEEEVDLLVNELINKFTDWSGSYVYKDKLIEIYEQLKKK